MRVLYDHQVFALQRWGGVSRYFVELFRGLPAHGVEPELALARSRSAFAPELKQLLGVDATDRGHYETFLGGARVPLRRQLFSVAKRLDPSLDAARANRELSLARLRAGGHDLFHPTYYDPYFLEALGDRPFVLTVHDLAQDALPALFPGEGTAGERRAVAARATRIIAISESTKRHLVDLLGVDPARVDVIYHGFAWTVPAAPRPPGLPERYVLYTGTRAAYKNWRFFVEALAPVLLDHEGLHLVCSGHPFTAEERALLEQLRIDARTVHVAGDEPVLRALYAGAAAFVFPSLHEGFGFPVLEALSEGCPTALANTTSLPEVGGDAAVYFDPADAGSLREAVELLLTDEPLRQDLARRGRKRPASFTWGDSCKQTAECYRRALAGAPPRPERANAP